jgi:hypothetical protein
VLMTIRQGSASVPSAPALPAVAAEGS